MDYLTELFVILNLVGVAQALLLAAALMSIRRGNRTANRIMGAFVMTIAISVGFTAIDKTIYADTLPYLNKIQVPFFFLGAPLLYLYIRSLVSQEKDFKLTNLLHFIPFCICLIYLLPFYLQPGDTKINFYSHYYGPGSYLARTGLLLAQFLIYLGLIASTIISYWKGVSDQPSPGQKLILFQTRFLAGTFTSLWVVGVFIYIIQIFYPVYNTVITNLVVPIGLSAFVYSMSYLGLKKPEILTLVEYLPETLSRKRYEKSTLTSDRANDYLKRLLEVMEKEKPYLDNDLTLQKLAKLLSVSPHHLSQTINERLEQNFFDFINGYRVLEAKKLLGDPARKHYSVLAIAESVGFNSKSAFNTAFRRYTNLTPSEFRKSAL